MSEDAESPTPIEVPSRKSKKISFTVILLIVVIGVSLAVAFVAIPLTSTIPEPEDVSVTATAENATQPNGPTLTPATHFALIQGLVPDPEEPGQIYVATFTGLVLGVNNSNLDYDFFYVSEERLDVTGFIIDPDQSNVFYSFGHPVAGEETGIRRSEDGGQTWELVTSRPDPHEWIISPTNPDVMYAVDFPSFVLVKTENGGVNWQVLKSPSRVYSIGIDPKNDKQVIIGTDIGLYISQDGGSSWNVASLEMSNVIVSAVAYSPNESGTIYARSFFGLYKSEDGGNSWRPLGDQSRPNFLFEFIRYIAVDNFDPNIVYAAAGVILWKSLDGGETWFLIREADFQAVGIILSYP